MARLGEVVWIPAGHLISQYLLTAILLVACSDANRLSAGVSRVAQITTTANFPYNFWQDEGRVTNSPATTLKPSSYEYYLSQEDSDLGSDPSTWKLLPIQIPDDLVSNAILKEEEEEEEEVTSSTVPSYPTVPTPQYGQHPGATEPQPLYYAERFHHSFDKGQGRPEPQHETWDRHSSKSGHGSPEPQHQTMDRHSSKSGHGNPESQHQTMDRNSSKSGHGNPEPQHQTTDRYSSKSSHGSPEPHHQSRDRHGSKSGHMSPEPQHHTWDRHSTESGHGSPDQQHQTTDRHGSKSGHDSPEPQHQSWDRHGTESGHGSPDQQHQTMDRHGADSGHVSLEPQHHTWDRHGSKSGHDSPEPQHQSWDRHSSKSGHDSPEPQHQSWDRHSSKSGHDSPEPQHQSWDRHGSKSGHDSPEPQHQSWDRHSSKSGHDSPEPQHQSWDRHGSKSGHDSPEPQHQSWDRHGSKSGHDSPEPQHQSWDRHGSMSSHGSPEPQHHKWDRHNLDRGGYLGPRPSEPHYHNRTHTIDGYNIRNHDEEHQLIPQRSDTHPNAYHPQHPMSPRPSAWEWKPPNAPSWQQNIVERLSQHLSRLPALPRLRLPRLGNRSPFPRMPPRVSAEHVDRVQGQDLPQIEGDYVHEFYPLITQNDPLQHLNSNRDRHNKPYYTYPPRQDHTNHDKEHDLHQNTNKFPEYQSQHPPVDGDDVYLAQHLTETTLHYDAQDDRHHTPEDDPQISQQEPYTGHHLPQYPHHTRPDPRRPFHSHTRPQSILKVQRHQAHKEQSEHHHIAPNTHTWAWEEQQEPPSQAHHPLRDLYNRRQSSAQNWLFQEAGNPGDGYLPSSSTHENQHHHTPQMYSSHAQRPNDYGSSHGDTQHLQQQELGTSWYSEGQHQQGLDDEFNHEAHNSILGPLSNLLSRPSPLSFIGTSPYQQSIIERITGVDASSTTSLVIPGGLLVLCLALALFYFNFVWYPTPVVTAKIFKMLSESASDDALSEGHQRAVGEVYRVFRGLEAEYRHNPSVSSTSCRSRLVCQVHQELPGLWKVTQAYAALVKSSLASSPEGDTDFSEYQEAARRGSDGENCSTHYHKCDLPPVPVKATLRKLLSLLRAA